MRYVKSRAEKEALDKAYRIYVTDALKMLTENTAKPYGGTMLSKRFTDAVKKAKVETRTSEEIIAGIREKIQLMGG